MTLRGWVSLAVVATVLGVSGCSTGDDDAYTRLERLDASDDSSVLFDADGWMIVLTDDGDCVRVRVGDRSSSCWTSRGWTPGAFGASWIGGGDDPRFVLVTVGDPGVVVRRWTDRNIGMPDTPTAPLPDGGTVAVIELADGERPFGIQILSADRDLIRAVSLLD